MYWLGVSDIGGSIIAGGRDVVKDAEALRWKKRDGRMYCGVEWFEVETMQVKEGRAQSNVMNRKGWTR